MRSAWRALLQDIELMPQYHALVSLSKTLSIDSHSPTNQNMIAEC
jgi:hypothetical protein